MAEMGCSEMRHMKIEVVKGDIADPASYEEYLQGKDGAFVNADCA